MAQEFAGPGAGGGGRPAADGDGAGGRAGARRSSPPTVTVPAVGAWTPTRAPAAWTFRRRCGPSGRPSPRGEGEVHLVEGGDGASPQDSPAISASTGVWGACRPVSVRPRGQRRERPDRERPPSHCSLADRQRSGGSDGIARTRIHARQFGTQRSGAAAGVPYGQRQRGPARQPAQRHDRAGGPGRRPSARPGSPRPGGRAGRGQQE